MSLKYIAPVVLVIAGLSGAASAVNLITNGSFETGNQPGGDYELLGIGDTSVTGWTTTTHGVERFVPSTYIGGTFGAAADGLWIIDLAPSTFTRGGIKQTVTTVINQQYTLSFAGGNSVAFGRTQPSYIYVDITGQATSSFSFTNTNPVIDWQQKSLSFTATSVSTDIEFWNDQDGSTYFAFIDSVSLAPVPEPATMVLGAAALMAAARKRRALKA